MFEFFGGAISWRFIRRFCCQLVELACFPETILRTIIQLAKTPVSRRHTSIVIPIFLLSDHKVHQRLSIERLPQFEALAVAIALVHAVDEDVHGEALSNEIGRPQTNRK